MPRPVPPRPVAVAVLRARRFLHMLIDRGMPADGVVWFMTGGTGATLMMGAIAELGVADELAEGKATAQELATRLNLDADALHRVLRALVVHGVVRLDRRARFSLTRVGAVLRSDHPQSMSTWVRYMSLHSTQEAWAGVADTLRSGAPSFSAVHGKTVWEHFAEHPDEERLFAATMRALTGPASPEIVAGYPWPQDGVVCDVAGGTGTLLAAILQSRPALRGVLVDVQAVLDEAGGLLAAEGVADRVQLSPGDIFNSLDAVADVYVLKDVLHDWDDERCLQILRTVRAAMAPGSRVVIVGPLQERDVADEIASLIDVQMLTQCEGGRQRSVAELQALLSAAGLEPGLAHRSAVIGFVEAVAV